jgi:prepilin-type processing-associated H-X9-DG protein
MPARRALAVTLALALLPPAGCAPAASTATAAPPGGSTTLLTRLGVDTVAMEQYTRSATRMDGVIVARTPQSSITRYRIELTPDGEATSAEVSVRRGDGTLASPAGLQSLAMHLTGDSLRYVGRRASGDTTRAVAARGLRVPYANNSYGMFELALARLAAGTRDSMEVALAPLNLGTRATTAAPMVRLGGDSVRITWFGNPLYARHDGRGNLLWLDGRQTTLKVRVDRVATTDLEAVVRGWSAREAAAGIAGAASTRDTVRATIGGAALWLDYGRPLLRGREVWVDGVLGDTLWRTGANAATQLRTSADLLIGGQSVPAGTYSLWTWAGRNGYHLVVNRQAGQWGTEYHADRDLIRVPLQETTGARSVERFTITLEPQDATAGELVLAWGTRRLGVPITTR